ncbi:MAG: dickkopf-related protein [Enhygromyxa sp.]
MTSFVNAAPRRKWHPSQWNIVRVGSAIGALALGACADDTVGDGSDSDSDTTDLTDQSDQTDYSDWQDGYHDYSDYSDAWDDYSDDYSDSWDGYNDYSDYADGWSDDWWAECYSDEECGPGWQCVDYYCEPAAECRSSAQCGADEYCDQDGACKAVELPVECLAPALQEIPLPSEAGGVIVALRFVNLDDDPAQELVLLRDDAIVIVDGDQATTVAHGAFALDGIAATDADGDGELDLVASSSTKLNTRVFQANGLGSFIDSGTGPAMMLDEVHGIDWPASGPGELLARTAADEAVILSSLIGQMPEIEALELGGPVEGLAVGDFNGDSNTDLVALQNCSPQIRLQGGGALGNDAFGPPSSCSVVTGDFDGDLNDDVVILRADDSFSVVSVLAPVDEPAFGVGLPGAYLAARPISLGATTFALVVQSATNFELLFTDPQLSSWCRGELDELPPAQRFAVGDFDGDGDDEIALVDGDGLVSLWGDD